MWSSRGYFPTENCFGPRIYLKTYSNLGLKYIHIFVCGGFSLSNIFAFSFEEVLVFQIYLNICLDPFSNIVSSLLPAVCHIFGLTMISRGDTERGRRTGGGEAGEHSTFIRKVKRGVWWGWWTHVWIQGQELPACSYRTKGALVVQGNMKAKGKSQAYVRGGD